MQTNQSIQTDWQPQNLEDSITRIFGDDSDSFREKSQRRREYLRKTAKHK
ncbi:hypothetical protein [Nitrosopumilus sp. S4]